MTRTFPLAIALSAYRDRLLCGFDDYRDFLDYMTGQRVALWQIPAARAAVARHLDELFPALKYSDNVPEKTDSGNAAKYVRQIAKQVGYDQVSPPPLPKSAQLPKRPIGAR